MKPLYIFDLDGTLALIDHRRHLVEPRQCPTCLGAKLVVDARADQVQCPTCKGKGRYSKPDWTAFFEACVHDQPNQPVINVLEALVRSKAEVWIWSGRSAEVMNQTLDWLHKWLPDWIDLDRLELCMRRQGDFTPDDVLKASWYDALSGDDKARLVAIFDDRDKVVAMWRSKGVPCFQVARGDF